VSVGVHADVDDGGHRPVRLEVALDDLLVVEAGVVAADDDSQCGHDFSSS
jgi:hypothetical protein